MDSDLLYVKNNNNQKMFPCGLFTEIKVFGSPKIPDWYENMLFKSMLELKSALQLLAKNVWSVHISLGSSSVEMVHVFWWIFCEVPRSTSAVQEKATTLFCCETPEMMTDSFRGTYPFNKMHSSNRAIQVVWWEFLKNKTVTTPEFSPPNNTSCLASSSSAIAEIFVLASYQRSSGAESNIFPKLNVSTHLTWIIIIGGTFFSSSCLHFPTCSCSRCLRSLSGMINSCFKSK